MKDFTPQEKVYFNFYYKFLIINKYFAQKS